MSRVILATGSFAQQPYLIKKIERNVYSVEELCYSLVQSAQFLDAQIMDPELVWWIGAECSLPGLAEKLRPYLGKERLLSEFVSVILNYVSYITPDKQVRTRQIVQSGQGMEPYARRLSLADHQSLNGSAYQAIAAYEALLEDLPAPEREMRLSVLLRLGGVCISLFRFRSAAQYYAKAYELTGDQEIYLQYLAAVRFGLSDSEYIAFISEHPEAYNASLELEKRVNEANADYEQSDAKVQVDRIRHYRESGQETNYEIALHDMLQTLKDDYRAAKAPAV